MTKINNLDPKYCITGQEFLEYLSYDVQTGNLYWRNDVSGSYRKFCGQLAGGVNKIDGYRRIKLNRRNYPVHRIVWLLETGEWPTIHLDHVNGIRDDNRFENLREATTSENMENLSSKSKSPFGLGVEFQPYHPKGYLRSKPYRTRITVTIDGKRKKMSLGMFHSKEEAQLAYLEAKAKYHTFSARIPEVNLLKEISEIMLEG